MILLGQFVLSRKGTLESHSAVVCTSSGTNLVGTSHHWIKVTGNCMFVCFTRDVNHKERNIGSIGEMERWEAGA